MSSTQTKQIKERSTRPLQSQNGNSDPQSINKIQPTGEQLRIAQITSSDRADVDPEMLKKIKEVSDLTGKSTDEAWTALHDCNGDANQAVELIFEKEGEQDEWQEKKKRKKPTTVVPLNRVTQQTTTMSDNAATDTRQERMTDNDIIDRSENIPRGQQRDRAPPRFQRGRGRGFNHSGANGEKDASVSRERGPDRRFEGGRGRRGGGGGGGGLGGRGGGRGGEGGGLAGRGRGGRGYNSNSVGMETAPHIDTWTNETAQNGRNNDTSIGAWGDTTTEEWTADEWSGSLEESLVLTRSMPSRSDVFSGAAAAASSSDASQQQHQQQQQQGLQSQVFVPSSHAAGEVMTDNMTSSGYLSSTLPPNADQNSGRSVGFDLNHLLPKFSEPYSSMTRDDESAAYLSHYTKKATECIKNAVGIGSSTMSGSSGHGDASSSSIVVDQMGRRPTTVAQSSSNAAQQIPLPNRVKQQQQQQMPTHHQHQHHPHQQQQQQMPQQQQHRPRLPPPSKIPSSAVEMPGSMGSAQLDVQFGNWDSSSSASASSSSAVPATIDASNAFLNDSSSSQTHLSSQFTAQQNINNARDQSGAMNLGGGGKTTTTMVGVGGSDMSLQHNKASGLGSMNDASSSSSSSAVLAMQQEMTIGGSKPTSAYQTNAAAAAAAAQPNELGNSNKMMANPAQQQQQQLLSSFPTSSDDRKTIPYASQQPSNQLSGPSGSSLGSSSQLGLSQLAYSSGVESAPPSVYKPSSSSSAPGAGASSSSAYSSQQPSAVSGATAPYGSTLHYPTTGPQAQMHLNYPVAPGATNQGGVYSAYSVAEQQHANFSNTAPVSYGAMATQAPTGFSGASKPYGSVADKSSNQFPASVLSQVYESSAMGNAYPTVNQQGAGMQMGYQSTGAIYPGQGGGAAAVGLSYEGLPAVSSTNAYQNPANLYRGGGGGGQMPTNVTNDFQSSISESTSYPRVVQTVATSTAAPQSSSTPGGGGGKLSDGLSKMSVKDSSVISQQPTSYEPSSASATSASSLSSSSSNAANAGNVASSAGAGSTMKTMAPATTKSTAASKTAMNWPPSAVPAPMMNVNPNYMISQPPGFQLATFGYPTAQQTLPYSYEDLQILQQRYALPAAYYDLPLQSSALPGRDLQASLTSASYVPGSDVKLAALMEPQVSVAQQQQQQQQQQGPSAGANQQQSYPAAAAAAAAMHPGYSYYYPPAAGMVPYYTPMIPVGGVAVPMVTNPTHGATTSSTQYQKPTLYGSHAFGAGGPSQDFSKTFNPQASVKVTGTASGITPSDMIAAGNAFGKSHVQGFDKVGFHSGTPPPTSFSLALATGTQGGALGQPAIYGTPYMPMMPHQQQQQQQTHSQLMHHAMAAQDSSLASRGLAQQQQQQANALQQQQAKVGSNKTYANPYWAGGN